MFGHVLDEGMGVATTIVLRFCFAVILDVVAAEAK